MSHPLDNMGKLSILPRELRDEIWRYFLPHEKSSVGPLNKMTILRTCKQIHEETTALIYDKKPFTIKLSPIFKRRAWFGIETCRGLIRDYEDGRETFANIPFSRFREIEVEISAPRSRDQGQLICLFHKALELSKILSKQAYLPSLQISLVDTDKSSWTTEITKSFRGSDGRRKYHKSFVPQGSIHPASSRSESLRSCPHHDYDFSVILQPFYRLHNVRKVSVTVPDSLQVYLEQFGILEGFASPESEALRSDELVQRHLDTTFILFEDLLDIIQGQTAGMMRLRRFSKWFADSNGKIPAYLPELNRIHNSDIDATVDYERILRRYVWMKTLNPMSGKIQLRNAQNRAHILRPTYNESSVETIPTPTTLTDGWSPEEWYDYYPLGTVGLDLQGT
ncbi:hypothetical protein DL98DRAFT_533167 [Cadophora sp. DSE1049]|nr:hypothetical protein DL98DRAFT_533167 [Cadophora sp. DSE1049]